MTGNQTLAHYDMVLGLSQNTINYQFHQLHRGRVIHRDWAVLMGNVNNRGKKGDPFALLRTAENESAFNDKIDLWVDLQEQIADAFEDQDFGEIGTLTGQLKAANADFDLGWDASIKAPTINILDQNTQSLILNIAFRSGRLLYRTNSLTEVTEFDLKNCVYAFEVPIGKLQITKDRMVLKAQEEMDTVIRESGLSDDDFTIESLFLNFENANIISFDPGRSNFPEEAALPLQVSVKNYFDQTLAGSDNPYVLGYGVSRRKISSSEPAMFQPTSLNFSTSYSSQMDPETPVPGEFSAFNFLMMLNNRVPPYDQNTGVLPHSLIESGKDTSSTMDGVFAIQKDHFQTYIHSLDEFVTAQFEAQGVERNGGFKDGVMVGLKHDKHKVNDTIDSTYTITRESIQNNAHDSGISVRYKIEVRIRVGVHIGKDWEIHHATLSTAGQHTKGDIDKVGSVGYLDFQVKAAQEGQFSLEHEFTAPNIAFDKSPNLFEGDAGTVFLNVMLTIFGGVIQIIRGIVNAIAVDLGKDSAIAGNELVATLADLDVLNQTNKVILPLGKIYTFKNLRHIPDKDIIAYDIAYAPVMETENAAS
ncbi:MAG: hypothetical protein HEP71_13100 [Roseivirga sp.]|nr:hypothetical protein [Roseivirga sp.]